MGFDRDNKPVAYLVFGNSMSGAHPRVVVARLVQESEIPAA